MKTLLTLFLIFPLYICSANAQCSGGIPPTNTVCAGAPDGAPGLPRFRQLVPSDLPDSFDHIRTTSFLASGVTIVSNLPACGVGLRGARMFVVDADSLTFHATAVGGGTNKVGVVCDGTNWYID